MASNQGEMGETGGTGAADERSQRGQGQGQRGRGRGRGRGDGSINQRGGPHFSTTEVRRGRGGRGGRGGANTSAMSAGDLGARFGAQRQESNTGTGAMPASPHGKKAGESEEKGMPTGSQEKKEGEVEAEVCWICASPIVHEGIAPCNHRTCHICCLRMRALYKDKNCAHCRVCPLPIYLNLSYC
jgi:E3 ubiquitin-protein ligase ZNF598